ncbi:hypothetical protein EYF80_021356 [Liparis tanakae]|uniref:Uncharacterized protein n=1 Tax=Liparis tanakae TaxID=230148 RepID=A0A4Z2HT12_9TELE|nr:hypothetical protein EYF80_021356 [Liparis tanakae]
MLWTRSRRWPLQLVYSTAHCRGSKQDGHFSPMNGQRQTDSQQSSGSLQPGSTRRRDYSKMADLETINTNKRTQTCMRAPVSSLSLSSCLNSTVTALSQSRPASSTSVVLLMKKEP